MTASPVMGVAFFVLCCVLPTLLGGLLFLFRGGTPEEKKKGSKDKEKEPSSGTGTPPREVVTVGQTPGLVGTRVQEDATPYYFFLHAVNSHGNVWRMINGDATACMSQCNAEENCTGFVHRKATEPVCWMLDFNQPGFPVNSEGSTMYVKAEHKDIFDIRVSAA